MSQEQRLIYVGMHDGVCSLSSEDGGKTWKQGPFPPYLGAFTFFA